MFYGISKVKPVPKTKTSHSSEVGCITSWKSMCETPTTSNLNGGPTLSSFTEIVDLLKRME